jgi:hypothetical protein
MQLVTAASPTFANILMYADDGIFYSNKKFSSDRVLDYFNTVGLGISPEKSG